jgi:hypothetical protein
MICYESHLPILHIWVTRQVFYKKQELFTLHEHPSSSSVFGGGRVGHILVLFVLSYYEYLRFEFRVVRNDIFIIKDMRFIFISSCL